MKTLLYQPVNLTDVYQPNARWKGPASPDANGQMQWVAQTDWYETCLKLGFLDAFFIENATLNRANWWASTTAKPVLGAIPPVPYAGMPNEQNSLPPNLAAVRACAGLSRNPQRFGCNCLPRMPVCFDIEDDGMGAWGSTLYAGMNTTAAQRQKAALLMLGSIRAVKAIDAQIPVWWYGAPVCIDGAIKSDIDYANWRDTLAAQAQVAAELDGACYSLYAWDAVMENPAVNFSIAARIKHLVYQFFADKPRIVLVSPVLFPNLNGASASLAGQAMPLDDWQRFVDYLIGIDRPQAVCLWPAGIVDPVIPHIEYLAKAAV